MRINNTIYKYDMKYKLQVQKRTKRQKRKNKLIKRIQNEYGKDNDIDVANGKI